MSDPRLYEWLALRRVADGKMLKSAGVYFDHGRPVPAHMTAVFDRLTWSGLLVVAEGDPVWDLRRISLTDAGQARYGALCQQRQRAAIVPPEPEFSTARTFPQNPTSPRSSDSHPESPP